MSHRLPPPRRAALTLTYPLLALLLLPLVAGCAGRSANDATRPSNLKLKLHTATVDKRYTFFELSKGVLSYGGGRDAVGGKAYPVTTLTDEQLDRLWDVIHRHNLLDASGIPFEKPQRVAYDLSITTGGLGRSIRAIDDKVPGVQELHELLFEYQSDVRFKVPGLKG